MLPGLARGALNFQKPMDTNHLPIPLAPGLIFSKARRLYSALVPLSPTKLDELGETLVRTFATGRKLILAGNGGSAAECQHFAAELLVRFVSNSKRPPLPCVDLTSGNAVLSAASNDLGEIELFANQFNAVAQPGDLLLLLSTSGTSQNLIYLIPEAKRLGVKTACITGAQGRLREFCDISLSIPSTKTAIIQEVHLCLIHLLCDHLEINADYLREARSEKENTI